MDSKMHFPGLLNLETPSRDSEPQKSPLTPTYKRRAIGWFHAALPYLLLAAAWAGYVAIGIWAGWIRP